MYLLDSDVVKKICQFQLLNELAIGFNCSLSNFAILPQLKFQLKLACKKTAIIKLGSNEAFDLAISLVSAASEVEVVAEAANPLLKLNLPDIDSGEATLFAALHSSVDANLISGDKRAFVALSKINGQPHVDVLWARLICLEEALLVILKTGDFKQISDKVRARPDVDMAMKIAFGHTRPSTKDDVLLAVQSYINSLAADTRNKYPLRTY